MAEVTAALPEDALVYGGTEMTGTYYHAVLDPFEQPGESGAAPTTGQLWPRGSST